MVSCSDTRAKRRCLPTTYPPESILQRWAQLCSLRRTVVVTLPSNSAESPSNSWLITEITVLGGHANRARLYDVNGRFLTTLPVLEAERMIDSGDCAYISRRGERPLRVKLVCARQWQPQPLSPTSGCTTPACITSKEIEANVGLYGQFRMIAAKRKLEAAFAERSKTWK